MTQEATKQSAPIVFTDQHPEYPSLVYNHKTRQAKAATDKHHKEELAKEGFVDEPYPLEDVDALTQAETDQLQALLAKAAKALAKLGKLSEKHEHEPAAPATKK
jgi:hypothetical protein